jgi:NAD(P)-dependent dehydrogenase (short-subunit alcohol dehydrogenase family)
MASSRVAVITGAGNGIGRACARAFARAGASVVVADVDEKAADAAAAEIGGLAVATDVANPASVEALATRVLDWHGRIDTLVNNAAVQVNKNVPDTTYDEWSRQMAVNVGGVFLCSKLFLPFLVQTRGSIVNLSSVNAYYVEPGCAGYCATKAAIIAFTKAMAIDHGKDGVRVNCICPGYIDAGGAERYFEAQRDPAAARSDAARLHALGRIGAADEVARVAVFLASADASFMTGSAVVVDGGFGSGIPAR